MLRTETWIISCPAVGVGAPTSVVKVVVDVEVVVKSFFFFSFKIFLVHR